MEEKGNQKQSVMETISNLMEEKIGRLANQINGLEECIRKIGRIEEQKIKEQPNGMPESVTPTNPSHLERYRNFEMTLGVLEDKFAFLLAQLHNMV